MPLISPLPIDTTAVLREAQRISKPPKANTKKEDLQDLLDQNCIGSADVIDHLATIIRQGETEAIRLKALDTALKLNGLLQNDFQQIVPTVNIIINSAKEYSVNPILIPRPPLGALTTRTITEDLDTTENESESE